MKKKKLFSDRILIGIIGNCETHVFQQHLAIHKKNVDD